MLAALCLKFHAVLVPVLRALYVKWRMIMIRFIPIILCLFTGYAFGDDMKIIEYKRHEFRGKPEIRKAELSTFVYDIPYFGACGIFPPLHIINKYFMGGGSDGGMSPGATWQPFSINEKEYDLLKEKIKQLNPKTLGDKARFTWAKFEFDSDFDQVKKLENWLFKVCDKHRDFYHKKLDDV